MKKVIAGCIDLMLEFDSASELDRYIADIEAKKPVSYTHLTLPTIA